MTFELLPSDCWSAVQAICELNPFWFLIWLLHMCINAAGSRVTCVGLGLTICHVCVLSQILCYVTRLL